MFIIMKTVVFIVCILLSHIALAQTWSCWNNGSVYANSNHPSGVVSWITPEAAELSDDIYSLAIVDYDQYTHYLKVTDFGFEIPAESVINGIEVEIERKAQNFSIPQNTDCFVVDQDIRIVKNNNICSQNLACNNVPADNWLNRIAGSDDIVCYGGDSNIWGESWTYDDINSSGFGVAVAVRNPYETGFYPSSIAMIDRVRIRISYSETTPIELLDFDVVCLDNGKYEISWVTHTETNNDYFTLESSNDGIVFNTIKIIDGAGNSNEIQYYTVTDDRFYSEIIYYRLKQTDYNGDYEYSDIIASGNCAHEDKPAIIEIYPVPANCNDNIYVNMHGGCDIDKIELCISDIMGNIILNKNIIGSKREELLILEPPCNISPGIYIIRIITQKSDYTGRIILR